MSSASSSPASSASSSSSSLPSLTFVTGNANKLAEVQSILGPSVSLSSVSLDLPEYQGSPSSISLAKAAAAFSQVRGPVVVEDTSLCFNALNGLPGPYIKWFLEGVGHAGLNQMLGSFPDKSAYAQCIFTLKWKEGEEGIVFEGRCPGKIVAARGPNNFGWDPIFEPDEGGGLTFAEMAKKEKNKISHRYKALEKLKSWLEQNGQLLKSAQKGENEEKK